MWETHEKRLKRFSWVFHTLAQRHARAVHTESGPRIYVFLPTDIAEDPKIVDACQNAIDAIENGLLEMRQNTLVLYAFKANPTLKTGGDAMDWLVENGYIVNGNPSEKWNNA